MRENLCLQERGIVCFAVCGCIGMVLAGVRCRARFLLRAKYLNKPSVFASWSLNSTIHTTYTVESYILFFHDDCAERWCQGTETWLGANIVLITTIDAIITTRYVQDLSITVIPSCPYCSASHLRQFTYTTYTQRIEARATSDCIMSFANPFGYVFSSMKNWEFYGSIPYCRLVTMNAKRALLILHEKSSMMFTHLSYVFMTICRCRYKYWSHI